jgi:hypothetical protein
VRRLQRLGYWLAGLGPGGFTRPACQRVRWEVLHASCKDYFIHAGCKRHITPQGAGVATGPVKFVVEALRGLDWTWKTGGGLGRLHIRVHLRCVGISMEPPVVGRDWSPVSSNKPRGYCCRTSCRPSSPIAAGACSPAVFAHMWHIASRLPEARGRAAGDVQKYTGTITGHICAICN